MLDKASHKRDTNEWDSIQMEMLGGDFDMSSRLFLAAVFVAALCMVPAHILAQDFQQPELKPGQHPPPGAENYSRASGKPASRRDRRCHEGSGGKAHAAGLRWASRYDRVLGHAAASDRRPSGLRR